MTHVFPNPLIPLDCVIEQPEEHLRSIILNNRYNQNNDCIQKLLLLQVIFNLQANPDTFFSPYRIDVCITVSEPSPESKPENEPPIVTHCSLELPESAVSITVTDASPESSDTAQSPPSTTTSTTNNAHQKRAAFRRGSEAVTIHHALVHRESEDDR